MVDIFSDPDFDAQKNATLTPATSLGTSPGEAFNATWEANKRYTGGLSEIDNTADAAQVYIDRFKARTGEDITNPYRVGWNPLGIDPATVQSNIQQASTRMQQRASELNDPSLALPDQNQLWEEGVQKARAAQIAQATASQGQQQFGTGIATGAAGFGSQFSDPLSAGLNGIAIATLPEGGGLISSLLGSAATFGAQQGAQELMTAAYKRAVNPDYGLKEGLEEVGQAALGGAGFELGGRLIGSLWRTLRTNLPSVASALPSDVRGALNISERTADLDTNNPFKTGLTGEAAANVTIPRIESDLLAGREPVLPPEAAAEMRARTGTVVAPPLSQEAVEAAIEADRNPMGASPDSAGQPVRPPSRAASETLSQPEIENDLGSPISGTLVREIRGYGPEGITGWHGTPHEVEKFSTEKIGTGEGPQAFGHGLYFAENRGVGLNYRKALTPSGQSGNLYRVHIDADAKNFVDWDRPLSEQPQSVKDAFNALGIHDETLTGGDAYKAARAQVGNAAASRSLANSGLDGIKYLDAMSRRKGDGTRNYVVFNDKKIRSISKNGETIPLNDHIAGVSEARLADELKTAGGDINHFTPETQARARELVAAGTPDTVDALEQAAIEGLQTNEVTARLSHGVYGYEVHISPTRGYGGEIGERGGAGTARPGEGEAATAGAGVRNAGEAGGEPGGPNGVPGTVPAGPTLISDIKSAVSDAIDAAAKSPVPMDNAIGKAIEEHVLPLVDKMADKPAAEPKRAYYGNKAVKVKYELAEHRDLITSHDQDFAENPNYPQGAQPRNRGGKPQRSQVLDMASNLEPDRLGPNVEANNGAPIVGPDNVVESGNGRTMAIGMAYDRNDAGAYRAFLERSGFDTTGFDKPVLVGRRITPMTDAERDEFAQAANGSSSLRMSPVEQAMSDARHFTEDLTSLLKPGAVESAANRDFVKAFVAKLPLGERGAILDANGALSSVGIDRVNAALVARTYGDADIVARLFQSPDNNIKTIGNALLDAAPDWLKMREAATRGDIPPGQDITEELIQAARQVMLARDMGRPVGEVMNQGDMFQSDTSQKVARLFFKDPEMKRHLARADMAKGLSDFAKRVENTKAGPNLFGDAPPTANEILTNVIKSKEDAAAQEFRQASLLDMSQKDVDGASSNPQVQAAAAGDLQRLIDTGKNRVPVEGPNGEVTLGFADKELHDLDSQLSLSQEIRSCSVGSAEAAE